jgi:hypothetical protein
MIRADAYAGLLGIAMLCGFASGASAQAGEERIDPDRPDLTNSTHIVTSGLTQIEFGGIYTRDSPERDAIGSPFTIRFGVFDWLEARIGTDGVMTQADSDSRVTGFGNVQVGAKLRLLADAAGMPLLSLLPSVNLPTADSQKGLGSGDVDYLVALLTGVDLGPGARLDFNYGVGKIGAGAGRPHFTQHLLSASASYSASDRWNPYFEMFWLSRNERDGGAATAMDAGVIVLLHPRLALDGGVQVGLTSAASDLAMFGGLSVVVGKPGGDGVHARDPRGKARTRRASSERPRH